ANVALLAMMFEDQSLTSDLSSYLNVLGPCVTGLLSE
ncbi:mCG1549, isoform CRA_a, partial [Mus musculus]